MDYNKSENGNDITGNGGWAQTNGAVNHDAVSPEPHFGRLSNGVDNSAFIGSLAHPDAIPFTDLNLESINTTDVQDASIDRSSAVNNDDATTGASHSASRNGSAVQEPEQEFRSLVPFCIIYGLGALLSQSVMVYLSSQITVLERVYGLSSTKSGMLLSSNDVGFVITVLLVSHFLKNHHIPRILSGCVLLFGVSGVLTSLPHFITGTTEAAHVDSFANVTSGSNTHLCVPGISSNMTQEEKCATELKEGNGQPNHEWVMYFIAATMFIQGVAKAPRSPLSTLYVDNNSKKEKTGFYIGLMMSFSIFGPFIAITAGGLFNKIPVDLKETTLSHTDPRWIGAWWLGFVVFGGGAILVSLPICLFPDSLHIKQESIHTEYANSPVTKAGNQSADEGTRQKIKDLPKSILRVLCQPVYTCNIVSIMCIMLAYLSLSTFGPKYIQNQFHISTSSANIINGIEKLVTTVLGTVTGGIITRRFGLGLVGCVKMMLVCRLVVVVLNSLNFLFGCDNPEFVGFNAKERRVLPIVMTSNNSTGVNTTCECNDVIYLPVCANDVTYFSPCHAGCESEINGVYRSCLAVGGGDVTLGSCVSGCHYLLPYVIVNALVALFGTMAMAPAFVTTLRAVEERDRSMAVGLQSFLMSLLVFLPAPILYGELFDTFCLFWNSTCNTTGSCALYDVREMRLVMIAINIGFTFCAFLSNCFTLLAARRRTEADNRRLAETREFKPPIPQPRTSLSSKF